MLKSLLQAVAAAMDARRDLGQDESGALPGENSSAMTCRLASPTTALRTSWKPYEMSGIILTFQPKMSCAASLVASSCTLPKPAGFPVGIAAPQHLLKTHLLAGSLSQRSQGPLCSWHAPSPSLRRSLGLPLIPKRSLWLPPVARPLHLTLARPLPRPRPTHLFSPAFFAAPPPNRRPFNAFQASESPPQASHEPEDTASDTSDGPGSAGGGGQHGGGQVPGPSDHPQDD